MRVNTTIDTTPQRTYKRLKNIGGGFTYEFMNAVNGLYTASKYGDTEAVHLSYRKLDSWGLEMWKQNLITNLASKDRTVGIPVIALNDILLKELN